LPTQSVNRRHTIVMGSYFQGKLHAALYRDWFQYSWCNLFEKHERVTRNNHEFHVVSMDVNLTSKQAEAMVDAALAGQISVIELREYSTYKLGLENGG